APTVRGDAGVHQVRGPVVAVLKPPVVPVLVGANHAGQLDAVVEEEILLDDNGGATNADRGAGHGRGHVDAAPIDRRYYLNVVGAAAGPAEVVDGVEVRLGLDHVRPGEDTDVALLGEG